MKPSTRLRSMFGGSVVGNVRSVSVNQAMRSRIHRTDPARALITSGSSSGDVFSLGFGPPGTLRFAAIVTRTTILRSCRTSQANLPGKVRGLNSPLNPKEF